MVSTAPVIRAMPPRRRYVVSELFMGGKLRPRDLREIRARAGRGAAPALLGSTCWHLVERPRWRGCHDHWPSERMDRMVSRARFAATVVWAISLAAAIGSVVLLAMSWDRALTDDLFSGFGGLSFATMSVAFASVGAIIT